MNGIANQVFHVVRCKPLELARPFDGSEISEVRWFTRDAIQQMLRDAAVTDGFTLTALLLWLQEG